jgi:hypothetical protein
LVPWWNGILVVFLIPCWFVWEFWNPCSFK